MRVDENLQIAGNERGIKIMKALLKTLVRIAPLLLMLFLSCKKEEPTDTGTTPSTPTTANLSGIITDAVSIQPLASASVILQNSAGTTSTSTGASGTYSFSVDLGTETPLSSSLTVTAGGHLTQIVNFTLAPGNTVQNVILQRDTTTPIVPVSGYANTIAYVGPTGIKLSVYGVGGQESALFGFEVRDSLGFPITSNRADTIQFSISGIPVAGGAYVTPSGAITSGAGRVVAVINSGTIAGTLSLIASLRRDQDGAIITSSPVKVIIHGGSPDQAHFAVGANPYNSQSYGIIGKSASVVTAIVGDKYGNPVAPNTGVYFATSQGVIGEGGFTDADGFVSANLHSGSNFSSTGFGQVNAWTIGANSATIADSLTFLFSGYPIIDDVQIVGGGGLIVDDATQKVVTFRVYDSLGNPMQRGSAVSVSKEGGATATFSKIAPDGVLPDTMSPLWTFFSFVVSKDVAASPAVNGGFTLTIQVSTPRANASYSIQGTVN